MLRRPRGFALGLTVIAVVAFAIRVAWVFANRDRIIPLSLGDQTFYSLGANLLASGKGFIDPILSATQHRTAQSAAHPPFYTIWLTISSLVWPGHAATPTVHLVWSAVLGTGSAVLCGLAGREIAGPRVGLLAAGLAAVYPNMWVHDGMLLSETAAIFTTAGLVLFTYRFWHRPAILSAAIVGLWCGLAGLAREK